MLSMIHSSQLKRGKLVTGWWGYAFGLCLFLSVFSSCKDSHTDLNESDSDKPSRARFLDISLPRIGWVHESDHPARSVDISVKKRGGLALERLELSVGEVPRMLRNILAAWGEDTPIQMGADRGTHFGEVWKVVLLCRSLGFTNMGFAVQNELGTQTGVLNFSVPAAATNAFGEHVVSGTVEGNPAIVVKMEQDGYRLGDKTLTSEALKRDLSVASRTARTAVQLIVGPDLRHGRVVEGLAVCLHAGIGTVFIVRGSGDIETHRNE